MNNNIGMNIHISLTKEETEAFKTYCNENGIIISKMVRRLILQEIKDKSTVLSPDFVPPKPFESLNASRR